MKGLDLGITLMALLVSVCGAFAAEIPFLMEQTIGSGFDGAHSVFVADFDGDGDMDVVGAARDASAVKWWENTAGDGSAWTEHTIDASFGTAFSVYTADLDGDGDVDVLGAGLTDADISWWENTAGDGTHAWTEHAVDTGFGQAASIFAADVDGDGDNDVLGAGLGPDDITWWENTAGDGSAWTEWTVDGTFDGAIAVSAADVDGDGDVDVLGAASVDDDVTWWENTAGDGTAWAEHLVDGDFDFVRSVSAADVDGDGDVDVLGAAATDNEITWWENTGPCTGTGGACDTWTEHGVGHRCRYCDLGVRRRRGCRRRSRHPRSGQG